MAEDKNTVEENEMGNRTKSDKNRGNMAAKKRELLLMLTDPECQLSKSEMIDHLSISRDTFYRWLKEDKFMEEVGRLVDRQTDMHMSKVWQGLLKKCKEGDLPSIKFAFEVKEKYKPQAQGVHIENNVGAPLSEMSVEELEQLLRGNGQK